MLDLNKRGRDVRRYVQGLERWIIAALAECGAQGFTREGRVGVWVNTPSLTLPRKRERGYREAKIAALGIRVRKWVTYHGLAINVNPDLSHYGGIVPCGISGHGVTSLEALGIDAPLTAVDAALKRRFDQAFPAAKQA